MERAERVGGEDYRKGEIKGWKGGKRKYEWRGDREGKERGEENNEVECKGWGTSGMSALHSVKSLNTRL